MPQQCEDPRSVNDFDYPAGAPAEVRGQFLLNYAVMAPSGHNTQPWLFKLDGEQIHIIADRRRALPVVDPLDRELTISCGAAAGTLEVAARYFGLDVQIDWTRGPQAPDRLATLQFSPGSPPGEQEQARFGAIKRRRTNRKPYQRRDVPKSVIDDCVATAAANGADFHTTHSLAGRETVAELVSEGDRLQFADPRFRRELAAWVHSSRLGSRDGMSGQGFGMPDVLSPVGSLVIRTFDIGDGIAAGDREKIVFGSPELALFATGGDHTKSWLDTGRALAHVLLDLCANGYSCSYLNQPIEVDSLRERVAAAFDIDSVPQILVRIGRGPDVPASARRPVPEVLFD